MSRNKEKNNLNSPKPKSGQIPRSRNPEQPKPKPRNK